MSLQQTLKIKLAHCHLPDIALLMGYKKNTCHKATLRIEKVLSDEYLNLYNGDFDFRYNNQQFLHKLCDVVNIDMNDFQEELTEYM